MINSWDNLPNGKAISRVLVDLFKRPEVWGEMYDEMYNMPIVCDDGWNNSWHRTNEKIRNLGRESIWIEISERIHTPMDEVSWDGARICARSTILALISDDECGSLLDSDPEHIKVMMVLGQDLMMMLCPGCMALNPDRVKRGIVSESRETD